ncbi:MAG: response regulator [Cyanobacteriota bacterium]
MKKILVIEDEGIIRLQLLNVLEANGFNAIGAQDGFTGVQLATQVVPDLILCNVALPRLNGYEVLRELRNEPITANIPFIFLSAQTPHSDLNQGQQLVVDGYLSKPMTSQEVLQAIDKLLGTDFS